LQKSGAAGRWETETTERRKIAAFKQHVRPQTDREPPDSAPR